MISLDRATIERCWRFARELVEHYRRGGSPASREVSYRGAEANMRLQAMAKMAECIFCCEQNLDPLRDVKWSLRPDSGADFVLLALGGRRVDVKATGPNGHCLIWSRGKQHIWQSKDFDLLALVRVTDKTATGETVGWTTKRHFAVEKSIARPGDGTGLDPGTWYMRDRDLWPLRDLAMRGISPELLWRIQVGERSRQDARLAIRREDDGRW